MLSKDSYEKIRSLSVAVFGLGGVGSYAAEAIARSGVRKMILIDYDIVDESNINRQLIALSSTIGKRKVDVEQARLFDINPEMEVNIYLLQVSEETIGKIDLSDVDVILDCIDDLPAKIMIAKASYEKNILLFSSMGFANKFDPSQIVVSKASQTHTCPLAKKYRYLLKQAGLPMNHLVVFSKETPKTDLLAEVKLSSNAYLPPIAGLTLASQVIQHYRNEVA